MKRTLAALAALTVLSTLVLAQTTTTAPATRPGGADLASPKAAVTALADATVAQDADAIAAALYIAPEHKESVQTMLGTIAASKTLQDAVAKRFGEEALAQFRKPGQLEESMASRKAAIDKADVRQDGDAAVVSFPADAAPLGRVLKLRKTAGVWQVDAASLLNLDAPATAARMKQAVPVYKRVTAIYTAAASDVNAGKITTLDQLENRLASELVAATAQSSTAPASQADR